MCIKCWNGSRRVVCVSSSAARRNWRRAAGAVSWLVADDGRVPKGYRTAVVVDAAGAVVGNVVRHLAIDERHRRGRGTWLVRSQIGDPATAGQCGQPGFGRVVLDNGRPAKNHRSEVLDAAAGH